MRNLLAAFAGLLLLLVPVVTTPVPAGAAAPTNVFFGQTCANDNTVTLGITWSGDPSAHEVWIDYSSAGGDFSPDTFASEGPLSGRETRHMLRGLTPNTVYWFRINQLLPSGDWQGNSSPLRYTLGCGNVAAPSTAKVEVTGFSDSARLTQTPPNRTLKACETDRLYVYTRVSGLTELTDVTSVWYQGSTVITRITSAWDRDVTSYSTTASPPPGGFAPGPYTFDLWTGGDGTWKLMAHATITLTC